MNEDRRPTAATGPEETPAPARDRMREVKEQAAKRARARAGEGDGEGVENDAPGNPTATRSRAADDE